MAAKKTAAKSAKKSKNSSEYTGPAAALEEGVRVEQAKVTEPVVTAADHRGKFVKPKGLTQPQKVGDE